MPATKRRQSTRTKASATAKKAISKAVAPKSKNYTRPGVQAAARLASLQPTADHADKWERALSYYPAMIKAKGGAKLVKLDKQREEIAIDWREDSKNNNENNAKFMTKEQLLDVMIEWKFTKGKPRHALKPLLKSNSDASVATAARQGFETTNEISINDKRDKCTKQMTVAMKHICELKGVGPATASAILCLYRPDIFAFMDDEVIECLYDGKRGYTMKIYMEMNDRCREIAEELNGGKAGSSTSEWTPCMVGKALWTVATMSATNDEDGLDKIFESEDGEEAVMQKNDKPLNNSRKRTKKC